MSTLKRGQLRFTIQKEFGKDKEYFSRYIKSYLSRKNVMIHYCVVAYDEGFAPDSIERFVRLTVETKSMTEAVNLAQAFKRSPHIRVESGEVYRESRRYPFVNGTASSREHQRVLQNEACSDLSHYADNSHSHKSHLYTQTGKVDDNLNHDYVWWEPEIPFTYQLKENGRQNPDSDFTLRPTERMPKNKAHVVYEADMGPSPNSNVSQYASSKQQSFYQTCNASFGNSQIRSPRRFVAETRRDIQHVKSRRCGNINLGIEMEYSIPSKNFIVMNDRSGNSLEEVKNRKFGELLLRMKLKRG